MTNDFNSILFITKFYETKNCTQQLFLFQHFGLPVYHPQPDIPFWTTTRPSHSKTSNFRQKNSSSNRRRSKNTRLYLIVITRIKTYENCVDCRDPRYHWGRVILHWLISAMNNTRIAKYSKQIKLAAKAKFTNDDDSSLHEERKISHDGFNFKVISWVVHRTSSIIPRKTNVCRSLMSSITIPRPLNVRVWILPTPADSFPIKYGRWLSRSSVKSYGIFLHYLV